MKINQYHIAQINITKAQAAMDAEMMKAFVALNNLFTNLHM